MRWTPDPEPRTPDIRSPGRYLRWLLADARGPFLLSFVHGIIGMLAQALVPAAIGWTIEVGLIARDPQALILGGGGVLGLGVVFAFAGILRDRSALISSLGASYKTMQFVTRHVSKLGATLPRRVSAGEVVTVSVADIGQIRSALDIAAARGVGAVIAIVVVGILMLRASWQLGLVVLIGVPLMAWTMGQLIRPLHRRQHLVRDQQAELTSRVVDIVHGLRVLRGIGGEQMVAERYQEESQRVRRAGVHLARIEALLDGAKLLLPGLQIAAGDRDRLPRGVATLADPAWGLVVTPGPLRAELDPAGRAAGAGHLLEAAIEAASARDIVEGLPHGLDEVIASGGRDLSGGQQQRLRLVRALMFDPEVLILVEPTSAVDAHTEARIAQRLRASRAGRATLVLTTSPIILDQADHVVYLDRIQRVAEGTHGELLADARYRAINLPPDELRGQVALVTQEHHVFRGTIADNLLLARRTASAAELESALRSVDAWAWVSALGLDARVGSGAANLSAGQAQQLALARLVLANPHTLVLDEATSLLDPRAARHLERSLAAVLEGRTVIAISHRLHTAHDAGRVVVLEDGRITELGTHAELIERNGGYAALWASWHGQSASLGEGGGSSAGDQTRCDRTVTTSGHRSKR